LGRGALFGQRVVAPCGIENRVGRADVLRG